MTIASDIFAALRTLDRVSSAEELWRQGGCMHAQQSFNATLATLVLQKKELVRWKTSKGFIYGLPEWKDNEKYTADIESIYSPANMAAKPIKKQQKQSASAIEKEAEERARKYIENIPAFNATRVVVTDDPKSVSVSLNGGPETELPYTPVVDPVIAERAALLRSLEGLREMKTRYAIVADEMNRKHAEAIVRYEKQRDWLRERMQTLDETMSGIEALMAEDGD